VESVTVRSHPAAGQGCRPAVDSRGQQQACRHDACGHAVGSPSLRDEQPRHQDERVRFDEDGGANECAGAGRSIALNGEERSDEQHAEQQVRLAEQKFVQ
jgi:hypothetical protein